MCATTTRFVLHAVAATASCESKYLVGTSSRDRWGGIYSAKAMTPMTVAMMMFTALSLIESASMPASFNLRTADAIQRAAAVSVAPKASPETMDVACVEIKI